MNSSLNDIDVYILAGGRGTRLQKAVADRPKPMADVNGTPFLEILLLYLHRQGFRRFILGIGYLGDFIEKHFRKNSFDFEIVFSKETKPLGTGGALKLAGDLITSDTFLVLNGDSFCEINYQHLVRQHLDHNAAVSIVVTQNEYHGEYGSVSFDCHARITDFCEKTAKQSAGYVSTGVYCVQKRVLHSMPEENAFSLENDFFPQRLKERYFAHITDSPFVDIGTPQRYKNFVVQMSNRDETRYDT